MPVDLDELEKLARDATPGPWTNKDTTGWAHPYVAVEAHGRDVIRLRDGLDPDNKDVIGPLYMTRGKIELELANAAFIAAANPTAVLELIERLRRAESR